MQTLEPGPGTYSNHLQEKEKKELKLLRIQELTPSGSIWLLDLCDQLPPSVQLDGLDISFQAAPVKERLPPNMALRHWDIRTDPPKELLGVYDIVHIRLFSWVLLADELPAVADRLFKLLSK